MIETKSNLTRRSMKNSQNVLFQERSFIKLILPLLKVILGIGFQNLGVSLLVISRILTRRPTTIRHLKLPL